jgi:predicted transcriptional regulator
MRREGWSFREIADTLGCAIETVSSDLREVLNHAISELGETTEEARQLEVERLDEIMKEYYIKATGGDMAAAALVLSIGDRRRKLMALDKPEAREEVKIGIRIYPGVNTDLI